MRARAVRQSELVRRSSEFTPAESWTRISFIDLIGTGPLWMHEPGYVDGGTLIAVWNGLEVDVKTWSPGQETIAKLHRLQGDWPPALYDFRVRATSNGSVEIWVMGTSLVRQARNGTSDEAVAAVRVIGRSKSVTA